MIIVGLDVSTAITGIAVLEDGKLLEAIAVKTNNRKKFEDVYDISEEVARHLKDIFDRYDVEEVFVEDSLKSFASGFSSANTIVALSKINALVCYECYKISDIKPRSILAVSARKKVGIKVPRKTASKDTKNLILKWVSEKFTNFEYDLTKHGNPRPGSYDRADAVVIAVAGEIVVKSES